MSDYPYFSLSELQTMRGVFNSSLHYIGPVGLNAQATAQWRQHKHWLDRIDSLIAEYEECLAAESEGSE